MTGGPGSALYFYPDFRAGNPYQGMLHAALGEIGAYDVGVGDLLAFLDDRAAAEGDPGVLCLDWTSPILERADGPFRAWQRLERFSAALDRFLGRGGRLVWTIHNVLPHETRFRPIELELCRRLAARADLIQVLSEKTVEIVSEFYVLDPAKVVVIEHSSYAGQYPDEVSRDEARRRLDLAADDRVILCLGGIRPYKGIDRLLDAFDEMPDPGLRLLIAGRPNDDPGVTGIRLRCEANPRVISWFDRIEDDQLQVWMNAADVAVLPYRDILNSGVFLLAQTFGLPTVGPAAGSLGRWADLPQVWLFDPADDDSLAGSIRTALDAVAEDGPALRAAARAFAEQRPPAAMAAAFAAAVEPLLRAPKRMS